MPEVNLHHERRGSGPPLVLVHGLGGTSRAIWKHVTGELERDFSVVTYDLRGTGESSRPPGPYSLEDFVHDLHGLIEALELEPVSLLGHSFGGFVALAYAAEHPERVTAVVAAGAPTRLPEQNRAGMLARAETVEAEGMGAVAETVAKNGLAPSFQEARPDELRAYEELLLANDPQAYAATCRAIADLDITDDLRRISAPVLLIAGDRDGVAPPAANREAAGRIASARYVEVEDCGHILPWEKPDVLIEAARSFLLAPAQ